MRGVVLIFALAACHSASDATNSDDLGGDLPGIDLAGDDLTRPPAADLAGADLAQPPQADLGGVDGGQPDLVSTAGCRSITGGVFDFDVPVVTLTGSVTINGKAPPQNSDGEIWLKNAAGDSALLDQLIYSPTFTARIVPGTYDVYWVYAPNFASSTVPSNTSLLIKSGVALTSSQTLNVDVPGVLVSGNVTVNGGPTSSGSSGRFYLRSANGDEAFLGGFDKATYSTMVGPGTYDVHYRSGGGQYSGPVANSDVVVQRGVVIGGARTLDLDVTGVELKGALTVNGMLNVPNTQGLVVLENPATGDLAVLGDAAGGFNYDVHVTPGVYDVYYINTSVDDGGDSLRNLHARVMSGLSITTSQTLNIDIPEITLSPRCTVNGIGGPQAEMGGRFVLRNAAGDEAFVDFPTGDMGYPAKVIPGIYDVYYVNLGSGDTTTLRNTSVLLQAGVSIMTSQPFIYDATGVMVTGNVTVNGAAGTGGVVWLEDAGGAQVFIQGTSANVPFHALIHPGTFDAYYNYGLPNTAGIVENTHYVFKRGITIGGAATLNFDVPATQLTGNLTEGGAHETIDWGQIILRASDSAVLGTTADAHYTTLIGPGTYDIYYHSTDNNAGSVVANTNAKLGCVVVP